MPQKLILVLGATGAQGLAVVNNLLAPTHNGLPSPYAVRALSQNPESLCAKTLKAKGTEVIQGDTNDLASVTRVLKGAYSVWVNTDGFTIGEQKELYTGMRIFELAKAMKMVKHFVWSSLDYGFKIPFIVNDADMTWSIVTSRPYMEMLKMHMFGPMYEHTDSTLVFASLIGDGYVPMIGMSDLGFFACYTFDNHALTSGKDLKITSKMVGWYHLVLTFIKVTGKKARKAGDGSMTWKQNFSGWWSLFHDDVSKRDMEWIRTVHPHVHTLETWMRETKYDSS
ncbi:hypothetical protein HETIRDRAFT_126462 [Heterobasidion irregulare TC 32-1]|uniref:NmrA-like domain-containing protein n=1 Tax=Heterobasidion irregulare (strain TC 32-1) TaxID=747525 RepID=W4KBF9_HETIT|nr:uncharacterized protein HETIRDRAFT_126462 [Heterobasidion irregulare TC 32-1]ETW83182.1 hypothetical protein HETIRDRAFT_126462 [Heterobasidion irregulare TC 32-1]